MRRLSILFIGACVLSHPAMGDAVVDDSFEDFAAGTLDASGQNLYVSHDGSVRAIHGHDLNDDGWIDLVFPQTHDYQNMVPATTGELGENRHVVTRELLVAGALEARTGDLNNDGWQDLVFCPNKSGIQNPRRFLMIIYGGEDGWPASRSNGQLPVNAISALELADLNGDGYLDIATLNSSAWLPGQPDGAIVRVYWGSERGFLKTRHADHGVVGAIALAGGDFNGDELRDLAILKNDGVVEFYAMGEQAELALLAAIEYRGDLDPQRIRAGHLDGDGNADILLLDEEGGIDVMRSDGGTAWGAPRRITDRPASDAAIGDLDANGTADVAIVAFVQARAAGGELSGIGDDAAGAIHVIWDAGSKRTSFETSDVPAVNISDVTIGDFDGDGVADLAGAIYQGETSFDTESQIFYGRGDRAFEAGPNGVHTQGAYHALTVPAEKGRPDRVVFSSVSAGTVDELVPTVVYWGGEGGFDEARRLDIPLRTGYEASIADLNIDGHTDLIVLSQNANRDHAWTGANIFYGNGKGLDLDSRVVLPEVVLGSSNVADLDKDGYLDIVLGHYFSDPPDRMDTRVFIYYGSADGYSQDRKVELPSYGRSLSIQLADYDKDNWLDIAVNSYQEQGVRIFYGSETGFEHSRRAVIDAPAVADLETADLDADGWLDLIATSYRDFEDHHHDLGFNIFWGSAEGFHEWNAQWLSGYAPLGPTVADWDADGYLDVFVANYHGETTREDLPAFLYWGGPDGYHPDRRTSFISDSAADGLAADFDRDGLLDIAVTNHTADGSHPTESKVYYNDGEHFASPRVVSLPTRGPHWGVNEDLGHIYNRGWRQSFVSGVSGFNAAGGRAVLEFDAELPPGTELRFFVRAAVAPEAVLEAQWLAVDGEDFAVDPRAQYLQYKAEFVSDNGSRYPVLKKVRIAGN